MQSVKTTNEKGELVIRKWSRKFLGEFPPQSNFDKAHLKAYLKGWVNFVYKKDKDGNPVYYKTQSRLFIDEQVINKAENNSSSEITSTST